jgi:UDP-N-acetylmuramate dehydrogenase
VNRVHDVNPDVDPGRLDGVSGVGPPLAAGSSQTRQLPDGTGVDLSRHTTLHLGGPARHAFIATNRDELVEIVRQHDGNLFLLAGGSNVVIGDQGVQSPVVLIETTGITVDGDRVTVEAGHNWDDLVAFTVGEGLAGIECLSGVPGSAGATPIQNVGAYGQEVAETIHTVTVLDRSTGQIREMSREECGFAYRTSIFKGTDRYVVLAVTFALRRDATAAARYTELARALGAEHAPLANIREAVLALRKSKGMVLDASDPDTYSVGSFFTNPVLTPDGFEALVARAGTTPPSWPGLDSVKVSAAWLIEHAGFTKGYAGAHVGVSVSFKHTLALTNRGNGTTDALLALAREIRDGVAKSFDVMLRPEPVLVACSL